MGPKLSTTCSNSHFLTVWALQLQAPGRLIQTVTSSTSSFLFYPNTSRPDGPPALPSPLRRALARPRQPLPLPPPLIAAVVSPPPDLDQPPASTVRSTAPLCPPPPSGRLATACPSNADGEHPAPVNSESLRRRGSSSWRRPMAVRGPRGGGRGAQA